MKITNEQIDEAMSGLTRAEIQTLRIALDARNRGDDRLEQMAIGASSSGERRFRRTGIVEGVTYGIIPPHLTDLGVAVATRLKEVRVR